MSQFTRYFCDQCKQEVPESNCLYNVSAEISYPDSRVYKEFKTTRWFKQICESCLAKYGIVKIEEKATNEQVEVINNSIETRLYEIISEMVQNCQG